MAKTISIDLFDLSSIDRAIAELDRYQASLTEKARLIREKIAERIETIATELFGNALVDDIFEGGTPVVGGDVQVEVSDEGTVTVVIARGKDVLFLEFGAGVHYNGMVGGSPHALGESEGMVIGEYGKKRGRQDSWHLPGSTKEMPIRTHGTPAVMAMYRGSQIARSEIEDIVREVFAND